MNTVAIYPGTFDPITRGHIDIAERASKIFDRVIIAVATMNYKENLFSTEERVGLANKAVAHLPNVNAESFDGLAVDFARSQKSHIMIRGFRAVSDFEYELQLSLANRTLNPDIETIFLTPKNQYLYLSSSLVKQIIELHGDASQFVPDFVYTAVQEKFRIKKGKK